MTAHDPSFTYAIGDHVLKVGGRYGGPGRIVGVTEDLDDKGYRLYNIAMKVDGGYGEFVHVFPAAALRPASHPAPENLLQGISPLVREAIDAVYRCSLVIESSVRRGDGPIQYAEVLYALKLVKEVRSTFNAEKTKERRQVEDETEILRRLAEGDTIVFSMDGDMAWFTKGDRAFVGNAIMSLREKGYLLRKRDVVDDDDDPRGIASYDTISAAGLAHLATEGSAK